MRYQEFDPPPQLAPWVKLFWIFENQSNETSPETIVADGSPELIVHFGEPFSEVDRLGEFAKQPSAILCGQLTRPLVLHSSRHAGMLGIRFHTVGMSHLLLSSKIGAHSMKELTDLRADASVWFSDIDRLIDEVCLAANDLERLAAGCRFLRESLVVDQSRGFGCQKLQKIVDRVLQLRGDVTIDALSDLAGVSRRSLELAFQDKVGISPKTFCRIVRFRQVFEAVTENEISPSWLNLALDTGFFDQSHLIRDFRQFTGDSPTEFLKKSSPLAQSLNSY